MTEKKTEKAPRKPWTKKKKRLVILASVAGVLLLAFLISLLISNNCIKVSRFTIDSEKVQNPVRIAVISDMHSKEFMDGNKSLYSKIEQNHPDIILTVGDMISGENTSQKAIDYLSEVLTSLGEIAPVYYSLGNHEIRNARFDDICTAVKDAGATLLEGTFSDITVNSAKLRLGGISYYRSWGEDDNNYIKDLVNADKDAFTLLLCHNPEFYLWGIENYPVDLTVSGHTHGGMVKLPLFGPVYAPEQGFFPEYAAGFYQMEKGYLAVTTGLGSSPEFLPRVFNRPEIMIIDVK